MNSVPAVRWITAIIVITALAAALSLHAAANRPAYATPDSRGTPSLMFGLGPSADGALASELTQQADIQLLTTWFNGSSDLEWLRDWRTTLIPQTYNAGFAHHVIVFNDGPSGEFDTSYGRACGLTYPLSSQFMNDIQEVAQIFSGNGPLYVTMFTEFQTYPCEHNQWRGSENYYRALQDQFLAAADIIRSTNPRAKVGLGWGGWQARWDDPDVGGGRSLIDHFADVLQTADYQAFQAMEVDSNLGVIQTMTRLLGRFGPVMVAHYLPDDESTAVYDRDMAQVFTDEIVDGLVDDGLFAFSFMDPLLLNAPSRLATTSAIVNRYGSRQHATSNTIEPEQDPPHTPPKPAGTQPDCRQLNPALDD